MVMKLCADCHMVKIPVKEFETPICSRCKERRQIHKNPEKYIDKFRIKQPGK